MRTYRSASTATAIAIEPGVDYFVARNVSLGFTASFLHDGNADTHSNTLEAGPRVAFVLPVGPHVVLYPRLAVGAGFVSAGETATFVNASHRYAWVGLSAPVLVDIAPRVFVGFGPVFVQEIVRSYDNGESGDRLTRVAGEGLLGGWF